MSTCILLIVLAGPGGRDNAAYVDLLRDAQIANRAGLDHGELTATYRVYGPDGRVTDEAEAEVFWVKEDYIMKYKINKNDTWFFLARGESQADANSHHYIMVYKDQLYYYDNMLNRMFVRPVKGMGLLGRAEVPPNPAWFNCCPPRTAVGRPWTELIGPHPAVPQDSIESFQYEERGDRIIQTRIDKDGGSQVVEFSMSECGNPVRQEYRPPNGSTFRRSGEYRWVKGPGGACVLSSYKFTVTDPKDRREHGYELIIHKARIDRRPRVDEKAFLSRLPAGVNVDDPMRRRASLPSQKERIADGELRKLADQLRKGSTYLNK